MTKDKAPWTIKQVDALNKYQRIPGVHPYTCANDHGGDRDLVATKNGWICCNCDYKQNWAFKGTVEWVEMIAR